MEIAKSSEKPTREWTLREAKEWCDKYLQTHLCDSCPITQICGKRVAEWDFKTPRLAKLLGVEVGQKFHLGYLEKPQYFINNFGDLRYADDPMRYPDCSVLCAILQDPRDIHID